MEVAKKIKRILFFAAILAALAMPGTVRAYAASSAAGNTGASVVERNTEASGQGGGQAGGYGRGGLSADVGLLRSEGENYIMRVTVSNQGGDFDGYVRLLFPDTATDTIAFDTRIALPSQGQKQFEVSVPMAAATNRREQCDVAFVDMDGQILQSVSVRDVFGGGMASIRAGVLSDDFDGLDAIERQNPVIDLSLAGVALVRLTADDVADSLDGLNFLIIDHFSTESLGAEGIARIEDWVRSGGWLIIGTGEYADDTLSGFDPDFIDVKAGEISGPGEESFLSTNMDRGYYGTYNYNDLSRMHVAPLSSSVLYESVENPGSVAGIGDGSVMALAVSLEELCELMDGAIPMGSIYNETMYASASYNNLAKTDDSWSGQRALTAIDNGDSALDLSALRVLIIAYLILAGPAAYIILRRMRKSEWYWAAVPALGIVFIGGIFLAGMGMSVSETRAVSVSVQKADSERVDTFYEAYRPGTGEWLMRLNDNYTSAGMGFYNRTGFSQPLQYSRRVLYEDGGVSIGGRPDRNFESMYLGASGTAEPKGTITADGLARCGDVQWTASDMYESGIVTNGTDFDFAYLAVHSDSRIAIFQDVKAGESIDIAAESSTDRCVGQYLTDYPSDLYNYITTPGGSPDSIDSARSALFAGLLNYYGNVPDGQALLMGVVEDYPKTVADAVSEISYGCIYDFADLVGESESADGGAGTEG